MFLLLNSLIFLFRKITFGSDEMNYSDSGNTGKKFVNYINLIDFKTVFTTSVLEIDLYQAVMRRGAASDSSMLSESIISRTRRA